MSRSWNECGVSNAECSSSLFLDLMGSMYCTGKNPDQHSKLSLPGRTDRGSR
jgi:hypothetical protein